MTDTRNAREIALDMLIEILEENKFCHRVLQQTLKKYQYLDKQDRAFISRLLSVTVKRYLTYDYIINQYASIPVDKMKPLIRNLLRMSVCQFMDMDRVPESAVCNEAVKLAKKRGFTKLSGFINGILRNVARNLDQITFPQKEQNPVGYLEVMYSAPQWMVKELINQYSFETAETVLASSFREKETTIRCNKNRISPHELRRLLESEGVTVEGGDYLDYAFKIKNYDYLEGLAAFRMGYFTVQDISSMLVCQIAGIRENDYVIDVCAAPGGKAMHAAETARRVSARDLTRFKVERIQENCSRLGIENVEAIVWDAEKPDASVIGCADVVIADLPCSGLGVLGKKPDIKYKLKESQLKELALLQRQILEISQSYVKDGGVLIYSTCTINRKENEENRDWFLKNFNFIPESLDPYLPDQLKNAESGKGYLQLLQGIHPTDGFFLSKFRKMVK